MGVGLRHLQKGHAIVFAELPWKGGNDVFIELAERTLECDLPMRTFPNPGFGKPLRYSHSSWRGEKSNPRRELCKDFKVNFSAVVKDQTIYRWSIAEAALVPILLIRSCRCRQSEYDPKQNQNHLGLQRDVIPY